MSTSAAYDTPSRAQPAATDLRPQSIIRRWKKLAHLCGSRSKTARRVQAEASEWTCISQNFSERWAAPLVALGGAARRWAYKINTKAPEIEAGQYPCIVKTTLDGVDQHDFIEGKTEKSARDTFFYYSGKDPSAVRYKNWKMYFAMVSDAPSGFVTGVIPYHWTQVVNVKRDPFETSIGQQIKTLMGVGGAISAPATAYSI
jgi:hypothetical protein